MMNTFGYQLCLIFKFNNELPKLHTRFNGIFRTTFRSNEINNVWMKTNYLKCIITTDTCYYYFNKDCEKYFNIDDYSLYNPDDYSNNCNNKVYMDRFCVFYDIRFIVKELGEVLQVLLEDIIIYDSKTNKAINMFNEPILDIVDVDISTCNEIALLDDRYYRKNNFCSCKDGQYNHDVDYRIDVDENDVDENDCYDHPDESTRELYSDDSDYEKELKKRNNNKKQTVIKKEPTNINYMVNYMLVDKFYNENGLFRKVLSRQLPRDIIVFGEYKLKFNCEKYHNERKGKTRYALERTATRCYTKLSLNKQYSNHVCQCVNNPDCNITVYYRDCPAIGYNGQHYVDCKCEQHIITKLANDWQYVYELSNDVLIVNIDNYGMCISFKITTVNEKKQIHVYSSFFGI
jgi:hypothetical protein